MQFELKCYLKETKQYDGRTVYNVAEVKSYKDKNGDWQTSKQYFNITSWKDLGSFPDNCKLLIKGEVTNSKKDDKYYTNFNANEVYMIAPPIEFEQEGKQEKKESFEYEEVPF